MKVHHVEFQAAVMIPGSKILGVTTLNDDGIKNKGLSMEMVDNGLVITTPELSLKGLKGFVPLTNIKGASFVDTMKKAKLA